MIHNLDYKLESTEEFGRIPTTDQFTPRTTESEFLGMEHSNIFSQCVAEFENHELKALEYGPKLPLSPKIALPHCLKYINYLLLP